MLITGTPTILSTLTLHELKIRHSQKLESETVLVMQGGGSLGAYECGVFKTLAKHGIKFDIVAGTSIGAVNAGIIAGSKSGHPEKDLEDFWLDIAETVTSSTISDSLRAIMSSSYGAFYGNSKGSFSLTLLAFFMFECNVGSIKENVTMVRNVDGKNLSNILDLQ